VTGAVQMTGPVTLSYVPAQGDISMGSYTNSPGQ
jgi:hypothetical protein